jgi:lipoprotein signal peptidase
VSSAQESAWLKLMALALAVFCADTWTKAAVAGSYELGAKEEGGFITILHAQNPGVNFLLNGLGVFPGKVPTLFIVAACVLTSIMVFRMAPLSRYGWIAAGLLMGAVLGNGLDMVAHGYVTDFIYVGSIGGTGNIADIAALTAVLGLFVVTWRDPRALGPPIFARRRRDASASKASGP